ncbi:uncharacterized protein LAESUDRAFT_720738 [Laetiporus sulphureus 93-53]|uniref:Mitochondrial cytochrome c oxidase assembly factor n=1 Tax=Laetiporus sulphureus 93-53 TaxID=1314785 RepID=A0A165HB60_9APHY|nr:uncharacterized protein LAESUDRAFT_720738 [Laetiporus sulphureus 93-53]KZT11493.1 hypothetical protein LAESUDRAFT_720738 [Laetiporus sulphureus 93-53]
MGGPNLEVFKFAIYVFLPVAVMMHYGDPDWYNRHVLTYRDKIFPPEERLVTNLPTNHDALKEELARYKARRAERQAERRREASAASESSTSERLL